MSTEQEYDAQADMMDDADVDDVAGDHFIPNFRLPQIHPATSASMHSATAPSSTGDGGGGIHPHLIDPFDPILDADPFGLSASMHFPNPFAGLAQARR